MPIVKTSCETVDQLLPWTDQDGRLNITAGDLVVEAGEFELVSEIHWNPARDMRVAVGFEGRNTLVYKDPAETVKVHRYTETIQES